MTESQILVSIKTYLENHNCRVTRLNPKSTAGKRCPDFELLTKEKLKLFCEIKSPLLKINQITNMFHWTTSVTKLRDHIHKAVTQFSDKDSNHKYPWVLVFTSDQMQLNWTNMTHAMTGRVYFKGKTITDLNHLQRVKNTVNDVSKIDFFVWMQMNSNAEIIQVRIAPGNNTHFLNDVSKIETSFAPQSMDKAFRN